MFSEKIDSWKQITAGFAIFGFILSFIFGLFGRVAFGVIILRAFLFAAGFGGLALLVMKLIEMFIPELISDDFDADDSEDSDDSVIIEEDADAAPAVRNGAKLDIMIDDDESDAGINFGATEDVEEAEEIEEAEAEEVEDIESAEDVEEVEELTPAGEEASAGPSQEKTVSKPGKKGDLPDIGVYADSFAAPEEPVDNEGLSSIDGMGGSSGAEIMGDMHDTQEIVKAVQTVLKKDQEG